jgi:MFS family permease
VMWRRGGGAVQQGGQLAGLLREDRGEQSSTVGSSLGYVFGGVLGLASWRWPFLVQAGAALPLAAFLLLAPPLHLPALPREPSSSSHMEPLLSGTCAFACPAPQTLLFQSHGTPPVWHLCPCLPCPGIPPLPVTWNPSCLVPAPLPALPRDPSFLPYVEPLVPGACALACPAPRSLLLSQRPT